MKAIGCILPVGLVFAVTGCSSVDARFVCMSGELKSYLAYCQEIATGDSGANIPVDDLVGTGLTSFEFESGYKIVYADARYMSFRAEEYSYTGGAHGNTKITVGTFDRATGRILRLKDVVPKSRFQELEKTLRAEVIKKIDGEMNLLGEVKAIDNFYVGKDGLYFVYNEYEVACYAAGAIEVVVDPAKL